MRYQGMDYRFRSLVGSVCDIRFVLSYPLDRLSGFPIGVGNDCCYGDDCSYLVYGPCKIKILRTENLMFGGFLSYEICY